MHFISSAMASFCLETTVEDAMQTVRDAGFDSLDFPRFLLCLFPH